MSNKFIFTEPVIVDKWHKEIPNHTSSFRRPFHINDWFIMFADDNLSILGKKIEHAFAPLNLNADNFEIDIHIDNRETLANYYISSVVYQGFDIGILLVATTFDICNARAITITNRLNDNEKNDIYLKLPMYDPPTTLFNIHTHNGD